MACCFLLPDQFRRIEWPVIWILSLLLFVSIRSPWESIGTIFVAVVSVRFACECVIYSFQRFNYRKTYIKKNAHTFLVFFFLWSTKSVIRLTGWLDCRTTAVAKQTHRLQFYCIERESWTYRNKMRQIDIEVSLWWWWGKSVTILDF